MVQDKSDVDRTLESYEQGDHKISSGINVSPTPSSDGSTKDREEIKDSPRCTKDESDDHRRKLNITYSKPSDFSADCSGESIDSNELQSITFLNEDGEKWPSSGMDRSDTEKSSNFSLTERLRISMLQLDEELTDLKIVNSRENMENQENSTLIRIRNYLAEYQGTPVEEEYTFSNLIKVMGQAIGRCIVALFHVMLNIAPLFELFLHILRFIVDKAIDIQTSNDVQQTILKVVIFTGQLLCVYVVLVFIFGFIIFPVFRMTFSIVSKILYE